MTRADIIVVLLALALLPFLYMHYWNTSAGDTVRISVVGQKEMELPLSQNRTLHIHGALGESVIEIHNGRARFVSSPCRGKQCIHTGWLTHGGEVAACLPNGVTLSLASTLRQYDSINF